jgi:hypothetical protein
MDNGITKMRLKAMVTALIDSMGPAQGDVELTVDGVRVTIAAERAVIAPRPAKPKPKKAPRPKRPSELKKQAAKAEPAKSDKPKPPKAPKAPKPPRADASINGKSTATAVQQ